MAKVGLACQLYTLREMAGKDFPQTIAAVARVGFRAVELAGYGSLRSAREVRKVLDDHGMQVVASHTSLDALERGLGRLLEDSQVLGNRTIVLSFLPEDRRKDAAGWRRAAGGLNGVGEECHRHGVELAYHHHHFEFQKVDGQFALDLLWQATDPRFLKAELDTFWLRYAGVDPVSYMAQLGARTTHLHLKDLVPGPPVKFGEVGAGVLDFPGILRAAEGAGVRWGIVEQDMTYDAAPLDAVRRSLERLRQLGME